MATKVLIAVLTDNDSKRIHYKVVGLLCQLLLNNTKYTLNTYVSSMRGIGEHRNKAVQDFLKTNYDYLMFIDSDNPPPNNVLDLIDLNLDVVGCPTPVNMNWEDNNDFLWNVFDEDRTQTPVKGKGLEKVKAIGTGCIIIKRNVLEKIRNPFTEIRDTTGLRVVSTDVAFCSRCEDNKIDVYAHWDYICSHYKEIDLKTII